MTQTVPDIPPLMPMHQDPLLVCKHVMQRQDLNNSLPCSCKVGEKWLCSRTYSGITRNWPARLGLLYLFIVGRQCHTRPLMHVAGVLGCCTPVVQTRTIARSRRKSEEFKLVIVRRIFTRLYNIPLQNMVLGNCHSWFKCLKAVIRCKNYRHIWNQSIWVIQR